MQEGKLDLVHQNLAGDKITAFFRNTGLFG